MLCMYTAYMKIAAWKLPGVQHTQQQCLVLFLVLRTLQARSLLACWRATTASVCTRCASWTQSASACELTHTALLAHVQRYMHACM
jgi:hypothetical protein